jgi:hypothetical protein
MAIGGIIANLSETKLLMRMTVGGGVVAEKLVKAIGLNPVGNTVQVSNLDPLKKVVMMMASLG